MSWISATGEALDADALRRWCARVIRGEQVEPLRLRRPGHERVASLWRGRTTINPQTQQPAALVQIERPGEPAAPRAGWLRLLARSQDVAYALVDAAGQIIERHDPHGMFGPREGAPCDALWCGWPDEQRARCEEALRYILSSPDASLCQELIDVRGRALEVSWHNGLDDPGLGAVLVQARDITAVRQLGTRYERSRRTLVQAQQIAGMGTWEWDLTDNQRRWSAALLDLLELPDTLDHNDAHAALLARLSTDDRQALLAAELRLSAERVPLELTVRVLRPDPTASPRVLLMRADVVEFNEQGLATRAIGTALDITVQVEAERARQEHADRLAQFDAQLREFSRFARGDFQEPLRKIRTFTGWLERHQAERLDEQGVNYLGRIQNAARRMQLLLDDLFTFAEHTSAPNHLEDVDAEAALRVVLARHSAALRAADARVDACDLPTLRSRADLLVEIFDQLITNTIIFRHPERPLHVRIHAEEVLCGEERWTRISVSDNGMGFDMQHAERVFAPFERLHGRSSPYPGTGMGLAICRRLVQHHGGQIEVTSTPDVGTTFSLLLASATS